MEDVSVFSALYDNDRECLTLIVLDVHPQLPCTLNRSCSMKEELPVAMVA
jgi:hypothetical protein